MENLEVKKYPKFILRKKCKSVQKITAYEEKLFENMLQIMHLSNGIGLAAPQIGISRQLIVADIGQGVVKLANPEILELNGKDKLLEGCLSIPGAEVEIERAYQIVVRGLNDKGKLVEISASRLLARVIQHEIDHLKGKLIIDYLSFWKGFKFRINYLFFAKGKFRPERVESPERIL
ncbi:MAG: peptide deformylase [Candidatus Margulisiibacteriota bacterium]|nr:peptide deformylase [Candidatus Margulisiibacteriota bacterium]